MEGPAPLSVGGRSPALVGLDVADDPDAWRAGGFTVAADGTCTIGAVVVRLLGRPAGRGVLAWSFTALAPGTDDLDGIPTTATTAPPPGRAPLPDGPGGAHANGAELIDHVVVTTPNPERTIAAFEGAGLVHRRTRLADGYAEPMRQDFFRAGEVILELIGPRTPDPARADRPARLYGLAHTVVDLDACAAHLGDLLTAPKDAVQPGRRIATLKTRDLAISVPTAFLSRGAGALR